MKRIGERSAMRTNAITVWAGVRTRGSLIAAIIGSLGLAVPARATTIIPMEVENLTRSADAVVMARVEAADAEETAQGRVRTRVRLQIDRVLAGSVPSLTLTLTELGGQTADRGELISGAPRYRVDETVVAFLRRAPGGGWRTAHLALGCFHIESSGDGTAHAVQDLGRGVSIVARSGSGWTPRLPLAELLERIRIAAADGAAGGSAGPNADRGTGAHLGERTIAFMPSGSRFFEVDEAQPIVFRIDSRGDALLGFDVARQAIGDAFGAWTDVASAAIELADGGAIDSVDGACVAGQHLIRFDDPENEIDPPLECEGVLGLGGACFTNSDEKVFGGTRYARNLRALVTFADGWEGCAERTACNFAEVATHEIGHALGLDHSSENPNETQAALREATMFFLSHFDGRCAGLRTDDTNGISSTYPLDAPVTITTPDPLPEGVTGSPYQVQLETSGGVGTVTWTTVTTECPGFPGLNVTAAGVIGGTPNAFGSGCFSIRATDQQGDSHLRRFDIAVAQPGTSTNTPTATRTASPTRVSSPTPTAGTPEPTSTPGRCVGDCDNSGQVRVNELVTGVNIALDRGELSQCPSFDLNRNLRVEVNELVSGVNSLVRGCTR